MPSSHKFKIGQAVFYRGDHFRIISRLEMAGGQPTYRIRHETDDNERVVPERELQLPGGQRHNRTRK
jgi:hypothetical protein